MEETEIRHGQKTASFEKLYGAVMPWWESYVEKMVIVCCLMAQTRIQETPPRKHHLLALISYSHPPLGVTCPIFSNDAFYIKAGVHPGIAAVELERFDGDNGVEAAILPQLKNEHKGEGPFFSRFGKRLLNLY